MGVVAPITGLLAAVVPAAFGIATQGLPGPLVLLGIAGALVAVVLVARVPGDSPGRSGIELALLAGVGLGAFSVLISHVTEGAVFGPLTVVRTVEATLVAGAILATRRPWRLPPGLVLPVLAIGALDMAGNALFVLAEQAGRLDVAAVLSSLYPVTTVVLAAIVLRERVTRTHAVGIGLAVVAIVLIASG
jgi:drug/metabolite transporter (DMT)-like permease